MVKSVCAILESWHIVMAEIGCRLRVDVDQRCLQDGVLYTLPWNMELDRFLAWLSRKGLHTQGYADDWGLLITGKFPSSMSELMQRSLNTVQGLCWADELSVRLDKIEPVLFTKKKKLLGS